LCSALFCFLLFCAEVQAQTPAELAYRDAVTPPPPGWTGPVFRLSHDYPASDPGKCDPKVCTWLANKKVNFNIPLTGPPPTWGPAWNAYIQEILNYVKQEQDPQLENLAGWKPVVDGETRWFHVPWMSYDPTRGREFVHGMTNERTATLGDFIHEAEAGTNTLEHMSALGDQQSHPLFGANRLLLGAGRQTTKSFETWAFGVYNQWGAWSIGKSWGTDGAPIMGTYSGINVPGGMPFPEGTVVAKLLFTTATPADVPYLKNSPDWQVDRHIVRNGSFLCRREVQEVRLIQLDVAVVDSRSPTRWVFGTFAYNGNNPAKNPWDRMEPVGLQWGSDPFTFPAVPKAENVAARQSVLNTKIGTPQHFGCNSRLAGPVDNKLSSCLSCHGGAFAPPVGVAATATTTPPIFGFDGECTNYSLANAQYFDNTQFPMGYTGGQYPGLINLDTSLQMQVAFFQYGEYKEFGKPVACKASK
jgi:hypothetical protein